MELKNSRKNGEPPYRKSANTSMCIERIFKTKPNMKWCDAIRCENNPPISLHYVVRKCCNLNFHSLIVMSTWKCDELAGTYSTSTSAISFYVIIWIKFKVTLFQYRTSCRTSTASSLHSWFRIEENTAESQMLFFANWHVFELLGIALSWTFHSPWVKGWGVIFDERKKSWKLYFECLI